MLNWFKNIDFWLFKVINQELASETLDVFMAAMSNKFLWIPLYLLILLFLIKQYGRISWLYILTLILAVSSADLISSKLMKPGFERTRPCNIVELNPRLPIGKSPSYGFVSSHAANHAAVATFVILAFSLRRWKKAAFVIWAVLIAYSRVYLGKHFFFDVFFGALLGLLLVYLWWFLLHMVKKKWFSQPVKAEQ
ncbi:MAG: phosphatase PAP2 family protein [Bacteroidia bacterium]|nr:phosphatase PAP2 family protein [Bacteroidia bacterium]